MTENSAQMFIYNDVEADELSAWWSGSDVYPTAVKEFLDTVANKDLDVFINSNGGSVMGGLAIYQLLKRHIASGNTVTTNIDGIGASIASVIAMAGVGSGGLNIPENAFLMIHNAWTTISANSQGLREMADVLDKINDSILSIYEGALKEGVDVATIKELMDAETWLTGKDAVNYFNINTTDPIQAVACASDIKHKNMPKSLLDKKPLNLPSGEQKKMAQNTPNVDPDEDGDLDINTNAPAFDVGDRVFITIPHEDGHVSGVIREANLTYAYGMIIDGQEENGIYHWYIESELNPHEIEELDEDAQENPDDNPNEQENEIQNLLLELEIL